MSLRTTVSPLRLLRQQVRDWRRARSHGITTPSLWETRNWLRLVKKGARQTGTGPVTPSDPHRCPDCGGTGGPWYMCVRCDGTGRLGWRDRT